MSFEDLYIGKIVKFSPRLVRELEKDPYLLGTVPESESYNCVMRIDTIHGYGISYSCVAECGRHSNEEVNVYDYEQISDRIGEDFFVQATISEFFMYKDISEPMSIREVYEFDLETETENVLEFLAKETGG